MLVLGLSARERGKEILYLVVAHFVEKRGLQMRINAWFENFTVFFVNHGIIGFDEGFTAL